MYNIPFIQIIIKNIDIFKIIINQFIIIQDKFDS